MAGALLMPTGGDNIEQLIQAVLAIGTLGTAAFALVDVSKAFWNCGVSASGYTYVEKELKRYSAALSKAFGADWAGVLKGQWVNGRALDEQKSAAISAIMLGLDETTARALELDAAIDKDALAGAAAALAKGADQIDAIHAQLLSRLRAVLSVRIDAAYERADQAYRNNAKALAMLVAIFLALLVQALTAGWSPNFNELLTAVVIGFLAVPVAPIAKDLTGALSAAAKAMKLGKA